MLGMNPSDDSMSKASRFDVVGSPLMACPPFELPWTTEDSATVGHSRRESMSAWEITVYLQ